MRVLFALAGMHRVSRGAEIAFESVAHHLALSGEEVTVLGSGPQVDGRAYRSVQTGVVPRERFERFPSIPLLARNEYTWEELTYVPGLLRHVRPSEYDVTVTCGYPYTNWVLRLLRRGGSPRHVFVTQNGDWPARSNEREARLFSCDGLVCTNPGYFEANSERWRCALIPNGLDPDRFRPGPPQRDRLGLPQDRPVVLMASALIDTKRVDEAVRVVSGHPDAMLVVAGDGPERELVESLARELLPGRFRRLVVPADDMPALYRSADAFLHLSLDEPFGNVYVESAACGLPVVAHDNPSTRWILGDAGLLVDTTDRAATTDALHRAIAGPATDPHRTADEIRQRFGWEQIASQYRSFLAEVCGV